MYGVWARQNDSSSIMKLNLSSCASGTCSGQCEMLPRVNHVPVHARRGLRREEQEHGLVGVLAVQHLRQRVEKHVLL